MLTTELSGRVSPNLIAEVRPQVGGIVQERLFTEGSDVRAGDVLYRIDPATYRSAQASAQATLARAQANSTHCARIQVTRRSLPGQRRSTPPPQGCRRQPRAAR